MNKISTIILYFVATVLWAFVSLVKFRAGQTTYGWVFLAVACLNGVVAVAAFIKWRKQ